jgi:tetratricopeptide (TPR) repeat protein
MNAPVIAAVNGTAAGAGMSLACSCDLVLAAESAKFTMAYTRAGLTPDGSSTYFLPRIVGLKRALELDARLAGAAAEIASLFLSKAEFGGLAQEALVEAEFWARMAVEIDPRCSPGWENLVFAESYKPRPDRQKSLEYALKAVKLAPFRPGSHNSLSNAPIPLGLGLEAGLEAYRLDTLDLVDGANVGYSLFNLGRSAEGLTYVDGVLSIDPEFAWGLFVRSFILADLGRLAEAADALRKVENNISEGSIYAPLVLWVRFVLVLQQHDSKAADPLLKEILSRINDPKTRSLELDSATLNLLPFLVRSGKMETALQFLKRNQEAGYWPIYDELALDPRLEPLRRDERFKPILEKFRADFVDIMKVLAQVRSRGELPRYLDAPFADLLKKLDIKL